MLQVKPKAIRHVEPRPDRSRRHDGRLLGRGHAGEPARELPTPCSRVSRSTQFPIAGKTGTAQVDGKGDTSLFAAMFSVNGHQYVIVAVVEQAGFGAQTAAPIVRRIIESMTGQPPAPVQVSSQGHD